MGPTRPLREHIATGVDLVKETIGMEFGTPAGQVNLVSIGLAFIIVLLSGAFDLLQALVRICRPNYTTGMPSGVVMFAMFIGLTLVCTLIVGLLGGGKRR